MGTFSYFENFRQSSEDYVRTFHKLAENFCQAIVPAQIDLLARIDSRQIGPGLIKRVSMSWTTVQ